MKTRTTATVIKEFLENCLALHTIPRAIRADQGLDSVAQSIRKIFTNNNLQLVFAPVRQHRAMGLVEICIRTLKECLMACSFQKPRTALKTAVNEIFSRLEQQFINNGMFAI